MTTMATMKSRGDKRMEKIYASGRGSLSIIISFFLSMVGGCDDLFAFLLVLVLVDVLTGFVSAIYKKDVSSKVLQHGLVNKIFYIIFVWVGVMADRVCVELQGSYIMIAGNTFLIRDIIVIYLILEELVSVLENAAEMGLPVPKWLRSVLRQVSDLANSSTPKFVQKFIKDKFGIDIKDNEEEKDNDNENE